MAKPPNWSRSRSCDPEPGYRSWAPQHLLQQGCCPNRRDSPGRHGGGKGARTMVTCRGARGVCCFWPRACKEAGRALPGGKVTRTANSDSAKGALRTWISLTRLGCATQRSPAPACGLRPLAEGQGSQAAMPLRWQQAPSRAAGAASAAKSMASPHQAAASRSGPLPPGQAHPRRGWLNPAGSPVPTGKPERQMGMPRALPSTAAASRLLHRLPSARWAAAVLRDAGTREVARHSLRLHVPKLWAVPAPKSHSGVGRARGERGLVTVGHSGKVYSWRLRRRHRSIVPGYEKQVSEGKMYLTAVCHGVARYHWEDVRARG